MRLEHAAVYVSDLEKTREFFENYFDGKSGDRYHNKNTGFMSYFLSFQEGSRLEIMTRPDRYTEDRDVNRLGFVHLAFSVGSKEKVDSLTELLRQNGYETVSGPSSTGDGYYESCIQGPDNILLEITV